MPSAPKSLHRPILTVAEMRAAEAAVFATGLPSFALMRRAGEAAARVIRERYPLARRIVVVCGPGNNGGDGYIVAASLAPRVDWLEVIALTSPRTSDAASAAALFGGPVRTAPDVGPIDDCDLVVDALFGIGLVRPLDDAAATLTGAINAAAQRGVPVVALDLASGIDADTGAVHRTAVRASDTIVFHALKRGHVLMPGRDHGGSVHVVDIGVPSAVAHPIQLNTPALWRSVAPRVDPTAHKYTRGHVLILAGGLEGTGASRLAARAALRAGAGLTTLAVPREALVAHASRPPDALMLRAVDGDDLALVLADVRRNVVVVGPAHGGGDATRRAVEQVLGARRAVVLDADALTAFEGALGALRHAIAANDRVVLTPHAGEFQRLFGASSADKITRTVSAARAVDAVVVHKGPDTVIAAPDGRAAVNVNAPPALATAGSGDVLAGVIAGCLAQGMPAFEAALAAVYLHGEAGTRLGPGLIADDLSDAVRPATTTGQTASR